jgi:Trk-type K+ transport system membrane component
MKNKKTGWDKFIEEQTKIDKRNKFYKFIKTPRIIIATTTALLSIVWLSILITEYTNKRINVKHGNQNKETKKKTENEQIITINNSIIENKDTNTTSKNIKPETKTRIIIK